jgi:hypothetical protein
MARLRPFASLKVPSTRRRPRVYLYNQKSHVPPSARSVPCWNLGDAVSNQARIAIGFLEPAV